MSRYRKIEVRTWSDESFRALTPMPPSGQGLWLFLLTGPHTGPIPGLFRSGRAAMAEELGWDLEAFDKAFEELSSKGMVEVDAKARLMWLPNAIKHNKPESPNVVKSWRNEFDLLPECELKTQALRAIASFVKTMDPSFLKAMHEAFREAMPKGYGESGTGTGAGTGTDSKKYPPEFELAWDAYPARPGASKQSAFAKWTARINEGVSAVELLAGTQRYRAYCAVMQVEPNFIKQPATFYGPGHHYELAWEVPAKSGGKPAKRSAHDLSGKDYTAGIDSEGRIL